LRRVYKFLFSYSFRKEPKQVYYIKIKMRCKIYLFRHGMTNDNAEGVFSGWRDVPLNRRGIRDARIVALRLKDKKFTLAFQSKLLRSEQTLNEVLKFHKGVKVITDNRITERNYGALQGKTHLEVAEKKGVEKYDAWHRDFKTRPPNGESFEDVELRVKKFIKDLFVIMREEKVNVAISAHNNSMRVLRKHFEDLTIKETCDLYNDYENVYEYDIAVDD